MENYSSAADRGDGSKTFRPKRAQIPGAVSTHAQAGQIEPLMIDGKSRSAVKEELIKPIGQLRPPCVPRTLRRNDDEGKIGMLCHVRRESVSQDGGWILPRLPKPMQEQDGWAFLVPAALQRLGNIQQVIQTKRFRDSGTPLHNLERMISLPRRCIRSVAQWRLFLWHAGIVRGRCANGQAGFLQRSCVERTVILSSPDQGLRGPTAQRLGSKKSEHQRV